MVNKIKIHGYCEEQFEPVKRVLKESLESGTDIGASFAATIEGEFVIDMKNLGQENAELKEVIDAFGYIQMILPLVLLILLFFMMIIIYKPHTLIMKYVGGALTLGGIFSIISAQLLIQIPALTLNKDNLGDMMLEEVNQLRDLYSFLLNFIVEKMTVYSVYFIGIGVLIFFAGYYISHFHSHKHA